MKHDCQKGVEMLSAQLKEQASQIQKVSAEIEVDEATPRMALSSQ
jgi:hypothetical protein